MSRAQRILVLCHEDLVPPDTLEGVDENQAPDWKTEYDVVVTLRELGHEVLPLGLSDDLSVLRRAIEEFHPHIAFNLLEEFHGNFLYDHYVVSYLALKRIPYTGCNPRGLMLSHDKALSKKILLYHRVPVPRFAVFPIGRKVRRPTRLDFPLLVKSLVAEGSVGISQASLVHDDQKLAERVAFVHATIGTDAIAEQFIKGREIYIGILGNQRLTALPPVELRLTKLRHGAPLIATEKVKWDEKYQVRVGMEIAPPIDLPAETIESLARLCKRAYRNLSLSGYARMDIRLTEEGQPYILEANPNPDLMYGAEFAESAELAGIPYDALLERLLGLARRLGRIWRIEAQA